MHGPSPSTRIGRFIVAVATAASLLGGAHLTAPGARAACEGGWRYEDAIVWAHHGAIVGTIASIATRPDGRTVATAVGVQHAYGIRQTRVIHGTFYRALCADNDATVGTRVLVLFGIGATTQGARQPDFFWTIGKTVTQHQVDALRTSIPDTATSPEHAAAVGWSRSWLLLIAAALGFGFALCHKGSKAAMPCGGGGHEQAIDP